MGLWNAPLCVGVDIGSTAVKAVQLDRTRGGYELAAFGLEELPDGAIVHGDIINRSAVVDALSRVHKTLRSPHGTPAAFAVPASHVLTKRIEMNLMSPDELATQIEWEAQNAFPVALADLTLDYLVQSRDQGRGKMTVFLIGAKIEPVCDFTAALEEAGFRAAVLDTAYFCLPSVYECLFGGWRNAPDHARRATTGVNHALDAGALPIILGGWRKSVRTSPARPLIREIGLGKAQAEIAERILGVETIAFAHIGMYTALCIVREGELVLATELDVGLSGMIDRIGSVLNMNRNGARDALFRGDVRDRIAFDEVVRMAANEICRGLTTHTVNTGEHIECCYLTGGGAFSEPIQSAIRERLRPERIAVACLDPFETLPRARGFRGNEASLGPGGAHAAIAFGLALRSPKEVRPI